MSLIFRLRERARIRRQIPTRKSVQENQPDRLALLLDEAAKRIGWLYFSLGALTGLLFGISVPYFFTLVAMILRHCGG
jgi:hypothetical protein